MTLGGGVAGIGFDGRGLGEGVSVIPANECNDQGDDQQQDLGGQEVDGSAKALRRRFEDRLVMPIPVV